MGDRKERVSGFSWAAALCAVAVGGAGCARQPAVSAEGLSLRRVVIYRNGVGYFERAGHIKADRVYFKVKGSEVGDFLATLAVIEKGGSSVRSASFPIKPLDSKDEPNDPEPPRPVDDEYAPVRPIPKPTPPKKNDPNKLETVVLELDGKAHDLEIGYIAETPVWRPSYRLVIGKGSSDLQAWGIVQNLSGEDWKGVKLSLIAGAPLAFEATLGTPVIPTRPTVTDMGEVIAAVPRSETSLNQEPMAPPAPAAAPAPAPPPPPQEEAEAQDDRARDKDVSPKAESKKSALRKKPAAPKPAPSRAYAMGASAGAGGPGGFAAQAAPMAEARPNPSAPRNLSALAAVAVEAGSTRYDIPTPVTVPDKSATMVMLLSKNVPGESIFLFAPDGNVGDSQAHPFRVARFTNKSGGLLERGPIAIFEEGAFLGQGMVDPLPDGATTTVPFALERSLAVETQHTYNEEGARLARIESGVLVIERDSVNRTRYRVKNGSDKAAKLLVKHPRNTQARLFNPPKGTEDNVGTATALVPVETKAHAVTDLTVDERQSLERTVDWLTPEADDAIRLYMADKRADAATVAALRAAWEVRINLVRAVEDRKKLTDEQSELAKATDETRRNLKALEKNRTAADLREQLTTRLAKNSLRLEEITKKLVEIEMRVNEQRVRFLDMIRSIKLLSPPKPE
jgi:hypothetical protein